MGGDFLEGLSESEVGLKGCGGAEMRVGWDFEIASREFPRRVVGGCWDTRPS